MGATEGFSLCYYQEDGHAKTLREANKEIAIARNNTPELNRHLYRSYIRFVSGVYTWGWVLR